MYCSGVCICLYIYMYRAHERIYRERVYLGRGWGSSDVLPLMPSTGSREGTCESGVSRPSPTGQHNHDTRNLQFPGDYQLCGPAIVSRVG